MGPAAIEGASERVIRNALNLGPIGAHEGYLECEATYVPFVSSRNGEHCNTRVDLRRVDALVAEERAICGIWLVADHMGDRRWRSRVRGVDLYLMGRSDLATPLS